MNIKRSVGARVVGFSHMDNILASLGHHISEAVPDGGRVLDVGCGEMHISSTIAERIGSSYELVASDINPNKLADPTNEMYSPQPNLSPAAGDATQLPFEADTFDITYSTSFFSHVHSHDSALDEQVRVTKPGGYILVLDENLLSPYQLYKWICDSGLNGWFKWLVSKDETQMLEVEGFKYRGVNENHYSPRYWRKYIDDSAYLSLKTVTSPRVEQDSRLVGLFSLPLLDRIYTFYETHTIVVARVDE